MKAFAGLAHDAAAESSREWPPRDHEPAWLNRNAGPPRLTSRMTRKYIERGARLPVKLSTRERDLVLERAFLDPVIEARLRRAVPTGSKLLVNLNLDDIDDLLGCVSAEANHCDDRKVQRILDAVGDRLKALLEQFTDELPIKPAAPLVLKSRFTAKQGRYLAFIHYYTKVHRTPPAEADLQRYFGVSPPAVHTMILTLERLGLIERTPGKARSVRVRIPATQLPDLS
jgi:repressor LexA